MMIGISGTAYAGPVTAKQKVLPPPNTSTGSTSVPGNGISTISSSSGTASFGGGGSKGTNSTTGSSGSGNTPGTPGSSSCTSNCSTTPPPASCTTNCGGLISYTPTGPPPPSCYVIQASPGGDTVNNSKWYVGQVQCQPPCTPQKCPVPSPCPGAKDVTAINWLCPITNSTPGTPATSWFVGVPGDGGTVCVVAWKYTFQGNPQTFTDGGGCYNAPPQASFKFTCGAAPNYVVQAEVAAPGGGSVTVNATYTDGQGYTYSNIPAQSFPQWFMVNSGVMAGPTACPNTTWNQPPNKIKITTSMADSPSSNVISQNPFTVGANGDVTYITYTPHLYGGHLVNSHALPANSINCASLTTDEYYAPPYQQSYLWASGGSIAGASTDIVQRGNDGVEYHILDGMNQLPYNVHLAGAGAGSPQGSCRAAAYVNGPTGTKGELGGALPYTISAIPEFTYTYGILYENFTSSLNSIATTPGSVTGTKTITVQVACTKTVTTGNKTKKIHTTCSQTQTLSNTINFSSLSPQSSPISSQTDTTHVHTITVWDKNPTSVQIYAVRPYIISQSVG